MQVIVIEILGEIGAESRISSQNYSVSSCETLGEQLPFLDGKRGWLNKLPVRKYGMVYRRSSKQR